MVNKISEAAFILALILLQATGFMACSTTKSYLIKEQGVWGKFYEQEKPEGNPILFLSGSDGGINEYVASIYRDLGFPVLSLGYFYPVAEMGQRSDIPNFIPNEMDRIPLELFGNGLNWLEKKFPGRKFTVVAVSKGMEGFLAFASTGDKRIELVDKAILLSGSAYSLEGALNVNTPQAKGSQHSSWTYQGKELPFVEFHDAQPSFQNGKVKFVDLYTQALNRAQKEGQLEKAWLGLDHLSNVKVLIILGMRDLVAPTAFTASKLLEKYHGAKNIEIMKLEDAGHMVTIPYSDDTGYWKFGETPALMGDTTEEAANRAKKKMGEYLFGL
jgi:uncharacterized protein